MSVVLKVKIHQPEAQAPGKSHPTDAGLDVTAVSVKQVHPRLFEFDTGISIQISGGYYCELVPRSSIIHTDFILANSLGVIDPDYRGRIRIILRYLVNSDGLALAQALVGERIAQLLIRKSEPCEVKVVTHLDETQRGPGGFGSTGHH